MTKKLIVILGPTASGKSELAIKLAKKLALSKIEGFNGAEIVSADSRQVYKGMDIGTGKVTKKERKDITHYLLDIASPKKRFTVAQYRKLAIKAIKKIFKKGKVPILCGGTGFYIQAVVDGITIPEIKPDWRLRRKLEKKSVKELYQILKKLDPQRAKTIEQKNKRRLIRALEIVKKIGPVPILRKRPLPYPVLMIGIKKEKEEIKKLIKERFLKWLRRGLIKEVKNLRKLDLSWKKIEDFGIHYRVITQYLQKKINYNEMIENSLKELQNYAKRQITWFKGHPAPEPSVRYGASKRIIWVKNQKEAEKLVEEFLKK